MRICVCTSYTAPAEPRAPRHAVAAKMAFPDAEVVLVDLAPAGKHAAEDPAILRMAEIKRHTIQFPTKHAHPMQLAIRKIRTLVAHVAFAQVAVLRESVFGSRIQGLTLALSRIEADVYFAHNIETLLPAVEAAKIHRGWVVFDCMEFYSDMGDGQLAVEASAARTLEANYLPKCALVIASSDVMADALANEYGIVRPLPAYNVPAIVNELPQRRGGGLNLYWRNSVIGFGQRGLDDVLQALTMLPPDVGLHLQGRLPTSNAAELKKRIGQLGLSDRVHVHSPYQPHEAVEQAAPYDIGLCLERRGPRNHELTVSNKMFDYHMAGLAVIATDLPALAEVIKRSNAGVVCQPHNPRSLADAISRLHRSPELLSDLQRKARIFALTHANLEIEIEKISNGLKAALRVKT